MSYSPLAFVDSSGVEPPSGGPILAFIGCKTGVSLEVVGPIRLASSSLIVKRDFARVD